MDIDKMISELPQGSLKKAKERLANADRLWLEPWPATRIAGNHAGMSSFSSLDTPIFLPISTPLP
jgi:hypothetical protein